MMRQVLCVVLTLTATAAAQERQLATVEPWGVELEKAQLEGKLRATMEMKTTLGAPYSAEATTEFVQQLADGNRIARKTVVRIYRDSEGRVRREHLAADGVTIETIAITDRSGGVALDPQARMAYQQPGMLRVRMAARTEDMMPFREGERRKVVELRKSAHAGADEVVDKIRRPFSGSRQDLGERTFEGVIARGSRTTTVIPAGAIGNDQPIRIVSEEWFSADLQVLVHTRHSDPRSGETTYTLSNITRVEPDRSLFEIPSDYAVKTPER